MNTEVTPTERLRAHLDLVEITRAATADSGLAECWGIFPDDFGGMAATFAECIHTNADIYEALAFLDDEGAAHTTHAVAVVITTTGWAAPVAADVAPSEHPERVRVRLSVAVDDSGTVSRITFMSGPRDGEHIDDAGESVGPLADAIAEMWGR